VVGRRDTPVTLVLTRLAALSFPHCPAHRFLKCSQIMTGQMCPCSATRSAPQIAGYAALEQLLVILDQYERTMTAMTGLEPRRGVIKDLMVVQHDCLSTPGGPRPLGLSTVL
jgi:hypothetical protein